MQAKAFLIRASIGTAITLLVLISINWAIDLYGVFRSVKEKSVSIYSDERTSKYLLAHRYVPENFSTYILGPSLSANLDPSIVPDYSIYNFSMMGANITEQKAVLDKALERSTPKAVVICLHPYLTMDHGFKTGMINPKEYWGTWGSFSLYKAYGLRIIREMNLLPHKFPQNQFNPYGYNNYEAILRVASVEARIEEELKNPGAVNATIDSVALHEFNEMINTLNERKVKVVAYFHPLPFPIFDHFRGDLLSYQQIMRTHLNGKAEIIDFTTSDYNTFTSDLSNYMDHGHFSEKGQRFILGQLVNHLPREK